MRTLIAIIISFVISIALFMLMEKMTSTKSDAIKKQDDPIQFTYLRQKQDTKIEEKKRIKPKEPIKKVEPKKLEIKTELNQELKQDIKIKPLDVHHNIDISSINSLSNVKIGATSKVFDANLLSALKRVNPKYPRRAKIRRQEGFVQLAFKINSNGMVSEVKVIDSNPKGAFEDEAIKAIKRWRFKASKDESKNASITFNFKLAR